MPGMTRLFCRGWGLLVKLADEQADILVDWKDAILSRDGILPQYALFALQAGLRCDTNEQGTMEAVDAFA
jgi:hypothetical protein